MQKKSLCKICRGFLQGKMKKMMVELLVKLSNLWGFHIYVLNTDQHSDDKYELIYNQIFSVLDSLNSTKLNRYYCVSLSLIWNQCASSLYGEIFKESFGALIQTITDEQL